MSNLFSGFFILLGNMINLERKGHEAYRSVYENICERLIDAATNIAELASSLFQSHVLFIIVSKF